MSINPEAQVWTFKELILFEVQVHCPISGVIIGIVELNQLCFGEF